MLDSYGLLRDLYQLLSRNAFMQKTETMFEYEGYSIPTTLVDLTGGGTNTWDVISKGHMDQYKKYCPIEPDHAVLEPGCGVGRDAIQLTKHLSPKGRYVGIDIIKPSIEWCQQNISTRFPHFEFHYLDIKSQIHNPEGKQEVTDFQLPVADRSMDRIVLQSVFTHMFREHIVHYLKEFRRVLKEGGLVMATFFVLDDESLQMARKRKDGVDLTFRYPYGEGCWVNSLKYPEGAVGYTPEGLDAMFKESGLMLAQPIHQGFWSGRTGTFDGQDIVVLKVDPSFKGEA